MALIFWLCVSVLALCGLSLIMADVLGYINSCFDEWEQDE